MLVKPSPRQWLNISNVSKVRFPDFQPMFAAPGSFLKVTIVIDGASIPLVFSSEEMTIVSFARYFSTQHPEEYQEYDEESNLKKKMSGEYNG